MEQLEELQEFIGSGEIDDDWFMCHMNLSFDDVTHTIKIEIDNVNEQDYFFIKAQ